MRPSGSRSVPRARERSDDGPLRLTLRVGDNGTVFDVRSISGWRDLEWTAAEDADAVSVSLRGAPDDRVLIGDATVGNLRPSGPSVVLITADTLRADFLSAYGDRITRTPTLDELARRGTTFVDVTTAANVTLPSHTTILTSLYPKDHGCVSNAQVLSDDLVTLAEILRDRGYTTGAAVASTVLSAGPTGIGQGFDHYHDVGAESRRDADAVTDDALAFLSATDGRPFFLWVHYYDPHMPYDAPPDIVKSYYEGDPRDPAHGPPLPGSFGDVTDPAYAVAQYRAEITAMDREVGRLLDAVDARGEAILCFTADHGESLTEHQIFYNHEGLFPTTVIVPWIVAGPGVDASITVNDPVETVDVAPTLLALLGVEAPSWMRGKARLGPDRPRAA